MTAPVPATDPPTVREAVASYLEQLPPTTPPEQRQVVGAALSALLEPALDEPVTAITPLRLMLLGGELRARTSPKTGRPLADGTFRRYVLAAQAFYGWASNRWPRPAAEPEQPGRRHLGSLIRDLRAAAGLTRQELGDSTVGLIVLKRVETGRQRLTQRQLDLLLQAPCMEGLLAWAEREGVPVDLAPETGTDGTGTGTGPMSSGRGHGGTGGTGDGGGDDPRGTSGSGGGT